MDSAFTNRGRADRDLPRLLCAAGGEEAARRIAASADPDMALLNAARFLESAGSLPTDMESAAALFAGSQSMSNAVILSPELLFEALRDRSLPDRDALLGRATEDIARAGGDAREPLRRFVRRETLRLLISDLTGRADLETVATHLSHIAEAALDAALAVATFEARGQYGSPRDADGREATITVIAMGKLGGEELNYSSDIDLIFLYSADGRTDAGDPGRQRRNRDFFDRVVEKTRRLLADQTAEGHCYRVDLRLRPEGKTGALTRTVASALDYYSRMGRPWERQALIKARAVAGDLELGRRGFLEPVSEFVYGAPLTVDGIRSIKELKTTMERRDRDPRQVKGGPGGIRDIEFTVQFLQLLHGQRLPEVRGPGTLPSLARLSDAGALTEEEEAALRESYVFLRTVEHRLQTVHEVQTHLLPADREGIRRLALRMGLGPDGDEALSRFQALHSRHTSAAREILARLFHDLFLENSGELSHVPELILSPESPAGPIRDWLSEQGYADPEEAVAFLRRLAGNPNPRARKFLASLGAPLLVRAAQTPEPDRCLRNLERVIHSQGAPATFYQLLSAYGDILGVFTDLCGWSQHLADILVRNPSVIDAFADSLVVSARGADQPWDDLPLDNLSEEEDAAGVLTDLKDLSLLRIGVRDIQRKANTQNTSRDLTALAEKVLSLAIEVVRGEIVKKHGAPEPGATARFAAIGLGKLGAAEMSYASDLDVLFVMEASGRTTGSTEIAEFFARLGQGVVRLLTGPGPAGRIYEVDPRVRPYGRSGPLVTSIEAFERYYRESAHTAELMMLTKARPVAGDSSLGDRTAEVIERVLYDEPPKPGTAVEIVEMRRRLEEASKGLDVKRGFGGIVDVEFIAEGLKLLHGHEVATLRSTGTMATLAAARRARLLEPREHETLLTALQFLRSVESRMRIVYDMAMARIPDSAEERDRLARRLGYEDTDAARAGEALLDEYEYHAARTRQVFTAVLGRQEG